MEKTKSEIKNQTESKKAFLPIFPSDSALLSSDLSMKKKWFTISTNLKTRDWEDSLWMELTL